MQSEQRPIAALGKQQLRLKTPVAAGRAWADFKPPAQQRRLIFSPIYGTKRQIEASPNRDPAPQIQVEQPTIASVGAFPVAHNDLDSIAWSSAF